MPASPDVSRAAPTAMEYRRLGRTGLRVSAVAFGTCQLRLVPEREALATLRRAFELGVNLVHTAPDYEGATELVARAVRESGRDVIVANQGYGSPAQLERQFETTCTLLDTDRLPLFGIACVDDRERLGENVFGPGGTSPASLGSRRRGLDAEVDDAEDELPSIPYREETGRRAAKIDDMDARRECDRSRKGPADMIDA